MPRPATAYLEFVDLSEISGKYTAWVKAIHLYVTAAKRDFSMCTSWVGSMLRESEGGVCLIET